MIVEIFLALLSVICIYILYSDFRWISIITPLATFPVALYIEYNGISHGKWAWSLSGPELFSIPVSVLLTYATAALVIGYISVTHYDRREEREGDLYKYLIIVGAAVFIASIFFFIGSLHFLSILIITSAMLHKLGARPLILIGLAASAVDYIFETLAIYAGEITYYDPFVQGLPSAVFIGMGFLAISAGGFSIIVNDRLFPKKGS